jgi:hypothetical protein
MMKSVIRLGIFCALLSSTSALADTIVWKDPVYGFTMSYPDSWTLQTVDTPSTRLRVAGPLGEDMATCRMKVQEDGRGQIYTKSALGTVVERDFNEDYWRGEAAQYENAKISDFYTPASLGGKGDATAVRVDFLQDDGTKKVPMYGVMIGGLYGDKRFIASCSSKKDVYARWAPMFASILDSVELDSRYHPFATGYYRYFLGDRELNLPRSKPGTAKSNDDNIFGTIFGDKYHQ